MEYKGKLQRWNDEKGFGFIASENSGQRDIFIHISELRNMSRRPVVGDVIFYQLYTDSTGKDKAIHARIDGVSFVKTHQKYTLTTRKNSFLANVIGSIFVAGVIGFAYDKFNSSSLLEHQLKTNEYGEPLVNQGDKFKAQNFISWSEHQVKAKEHQKSEQNPLSHQNNNEQQSNSSYQCDGRQHCSQMTSCAEARFFINNCPDTKMDGDGDGMPCEEMCGH